MLESIKRNSDNDIFACADYLLNAGIHPKDRYFNVANLIRKEYQTYIIVSKKGIGKTYSMIRMGLLMYQKYGHRFAFLRRSKTERDGFIKGVLKPLLPQFNMGYSNGTIYELDKDKPNLRNPENKIVGHILSLSTASTSASTIDGGVKYIFFDEFVSKSYFYLPHELEIFLELIKTLERDQERIKIILSSNANDHNNPYINYWDIPSKWWIYENKKDGENILYLRIPEAFFIPTDNPNFTSQSWVKRDERMDAFLNKAMFLRTDDIVKTQRELSQFNRELMYYIQLNKNFYALYKITDGKTYKKLLEPYFGATNDTMVYNFTSVDNFNAKGCFPSDPTSFFRTWLEWLNAHNLWFGSYVARDELFTFIPRLFRNLPKVELKWL